MADVKVHKLMPKGVYVCPECGNRVQVFVGLLSAPECNRHTGGPKRMEAKK
jgi:predicted nucleic acid-binding Zn ribbon protein